MDLRSEILGVFSSLGKEVPDADAEAIVEAGILDSLSILELINALESRFEIMFEEEDLTLDNFAGLSTIQELVQTRMGGAPA